MTLEGLMQPTPLTIRMIFDRMRTVYADGEVVSPEGRSTYGELADRVLRLARVLRDDLGVQPGDRVATFAHNTARHLELYYAVPLVGAVLHTLNIRLHADQIAWIANHAEDVAVFFDGDDDFGPVLEEVAPQLRTVRHWVRLSGTAGSDLPGVREHDELVAATAPLDPDQLPEVDEDAACGLCYTSGTTGMPKGVLYSHRGAVLHAFATCMADHLGLRETDRVLPVVPMFHAFGWSLPYAAPFTGAELVLHGRDSSPANVGRVIERERVTVTAAVPTIWKTLLPVVRAGEVDISSLRLIGVGGSASPRALIEAYDDLGIGYLQIWGMTETGPLACVSRPRRRHLDWSRDAQLDQREKTGTIFSGLEARITDDDGETLPWDGQAVGELEVRGPWIASSYYLPPDAPQADRDDVAARFHDGWLRTGDVAYMEPDGYFRIVDRAKDLVKSGGEWISSVELEGHLLAHPGVADAAVVAVPSAKWDERPLAVIVPEDPDAPPTLDDLHSFLTDRVARWWFPDDVVVVDEIPKTSVGKLDKKSIRTQLGDLVDTEAPIAVPHDQEIDA
jgi:fatty-acyl-CoA synthase